MTPEPWPVEIRVRTGGGAARVAFDDGRAFELSARLLRAMTPSAQDRGHGGPSFAPVTGLPAHLTITALSLVGRYAVRIAFDDGHDSGLYTWARLHRIGREGAVLEAGLG